MTSFEHDPPAANVQRVSETIVSPEAASKKVVKLRQVPTTLVAPVPPPPEPPPAKPGPPSSRPPWGHAVVTPAAATTASSPSRARLPPRRRASPPGSPRRCRAIASPSARRPQCGNTPRRPPGNPCPRRDQPRGERREGAQLGGPRVRGGGSERTGGHRPGAAQRRHRCDAAVRDDLACGAPGGAPL